jgi:hypothetical protein
MRLGREGVRDSVSCVSSVPMWCRILSRSLEKGSLLSDGYTHSTSMAYRRNRGLLFCLNLREIRSVRGCLFVWAPEPVESCCSNRCKEDKEDKIEEGLKGKK